MNHPLMLLHMITVILTLLVCVNVVSCDTNVTRARRTSDRFAWVMKDVEDDPYAWVMDASESSEDENSEPTSSSTADDLILIGDMAFRKQDLSSNIQTDGSVQYSVVKNTQSTWTNGEMPVKIGKSIRQDVRKTIQKAMETITDKTCIRIVPYQKSRHYNYVHIISHKEGCYAYVGQIGNGAQELNLQPIPHCNSERTIIHELMHALGVYHEQQRYDRDNYIEVLESNLRPDAVSEYKIVSSERMTTLGLAYDYGSIMHYSVYQGSYRNLPAFRVRGTYDENSIGKMPYLSQLDIRKLNKLYGCNQTPDDNDDDRPISPLPTQPLAPTNDGGGNTACDSATGCCVTCNWIGFLANCNSNNCNCHCTCYSSNKHCSCQCNRIVYVSGPVIYQSSIIHG